MGEQAQLTKELASQLERLNKKSSHLAKSCQGESRELDELVKLRQRYKDEVKASLDDCSVTHRALEDVATQAQRQAQNLKERAQLKREKYEAAKESSELGRLGGLAVVTAGCLACAILLAFSAPVVVAGITITAAAKVAALIARASQVFAQYCVDRA